MGEFDEILNRLETLLPRLEALDEPQRSEVFGFLDALDAVHRLALGRLAAGLGPETLGAVRGDPAAPRPPRPVRPRPR